MGSQLDLKGPDADGGAQRRSKLRYLAPLLSVSILVAIIARSGQCGEAEEADQPAWLVSDPAANSGKSKPRPDLLRSTKSFGIELPPDQVAPGEAPAQDNPPVETREQAAPGSASFDLLNSLGGSKSGFGGLGLRGAGRPVSEQGNVEPSVGATSEPQPPKAKTQRRKARP